MSDVADIEIDVDAHLFHRVLCSVQENIWLKKEIGEYANEECYLLIRDFY